MIPNFDIFRSASVIMKQHREDAPIEAAMRADAMLEAGGWRLGRACSVETHPAGGGGVAGYGA